MKIYKPKQTGFMRKILSGITLAVGLIIGFSQANAVSIGFDAGDLANFNVSDPHAITPGAGVGGTSGLTTTSSFDNNALVYKTPFANTAGAVFKTSIMYFLQPQTTGPDVRLGFTSNPNDNVFNRGTENFYVETCCGAGNTTTDFFSIWGGSSRTNFPSVIVNNQQWVRLAVSLTNVDGLGAFTGIAELSEFGATGTGSGNILSSQAFAFNSVAFAAHTNLYAGFTTHSGTTAYDNFTASDPTTVPEPTTLALLAFGLAGISVSRRKTA